MAPHLATGAVVNLKSLLAFSRPIALPSGPIRPTDPPSTSSQCLLACALSALALASPPLPAAASIPLSSPPPQEQQRRALGQLGVAVRRPPSISSTRQPSEEPVSVQIEKVAALKAASEAAAASGDYTEALRCETEIVQRYGDLALAERARVRRALLLFQVGRSEDALYQLEDEEVALRGNAEVHAALAAVLYDRGRVSAAEQQWDIATEFDSRYADVRWVTAERRWPPALLDALQRFLSLS